MVNWKSLVGVTAAEKEWKGIKIIQSFLFSHLLTSWPFTHLQNDMFNIYIYDSHISMNLETDLLQWMGRQAVQTQELGDGTYYLCERRRPTYSRQVSKLVKID